MNTSQLKKSALAVAMASTVVLSGCGGSGDGSNTDTSNPDKNPTPQTNLKTVASSPLPKNFTQQLPTPENKQVKKAVYAKTHRLDLKDVYYKDIAVDGNIVKLNSSYKVGDTLELKNTVLKITDSMGDDTFAVKAAELFDIFDELEIKTSLPMNTNKPIQTGLVSTEDTIKAYNALADRNCLPTESNVQINGNSGLHKTGIGSYRGKQFSLDGCKIYQDSTGSVTADASVSVGMVQDYELKIDKKKDIYRFKFILDGAMATAGGLTINADSGKVLSTTIYRFVPDVTKKLPDDIAKTLKKVITAEINLNLVTKLGGKFNGETRLQVPADFAFGMEANFDPETKKWNYKSYNLNNGKKILMSDTAGLGYNIKEADVKVGTYVALGYDFDLSTRFDWEKAKKDESAFKRWLRKTYEAGTTASLSVHSKSSVQAGLSLSARAGTEVPISQCRANVNAEVGFYTFNGANLRVGAFDAGIGYDPDTYHILNKSTHSIFNGVPIVLKTWNLFDAPMSLKKTDWCGENSKMKGFATNAGSEILVTDLDGNVLLSSEYILDWGKPTSLQNGLVALAKENPTQLEPTKTEVKLPLPLNTYGVPMNITFKNEKSDVNYLSGEWKYKWVTLNKNLRIEDKTSKTAKIYTNCTTDCDLDQKANIALFAIAPDGQVRYMSFRPTFETQLSFDAKVKVMTATMEMYIQNTDQSKVQSVQWLTDEGRKIQTSKLNFSVAKFSKFYQSAIKTGKLKVIITDKSGNETVKAITFAKPQATEAELIEAGVNKLVGYWKSECNSDGNNGSRYTYNQMVKNSSTSIKNVAFVKEVFESSDCSGAVKEKVSDTDVTVHELSNPTTKNGYTHFDVSNTYGNAGITIVSNDKILMGSEDGASKRISASEFPSGSYEPDTGNGIVRENIGNKWEALVSPNGGEKWKNGESHKIQWITQYITGSSVDIYVLHDDPTGLEDKTNQKIGNVINTKNWYKFASNVPNTGSYVIDPKVMSGTGNAYKVLVVSTSDNSKFDISDGTFSLNQ